MGFGATCPGPRPDADGYKTLSQYVDQIRAIIEQGVVDIMLTSVGTFELLKRAQAFDQTDITATVRLNDSTDIWSNRGGSYLQTPLRQLPRAGQMGGRH